MCRWLAARSHLGQRRNLMNSIAYDIGGVFLLAAIAMIYGRVRGLLPRGLRTGAIPAVIGIGVLGLAAYQFWPNLSAALWSLGGAGNNRPASGSSSTSATPGAKSAAHAAIPEKPAATHWKTIIVDDSVPQPPEPAAVTATPAEPEPVRGAAPAHADDGTSPATFSSPASKASARDSSAGNPSESSPYDSKTKRGIKAIGRFLHRSRSRQNEVVNEPE